MSTENLEQFMSKVADSDELQATIGEKIDAALIALGAECGCEFTAHELHDHMYDEDGLTHSKLDYGGFLLLISNIYYVDNHTRFTPDFISS